MWINVAILGSLGLVELGTLITKSGGDYAYIHEAFGSVPAFLYAWLSILFLRPAGGSIMALTCAEYVMAPFFNDGCGRSPEILRKLTATAVISKKFLYFPRNLLGWRHLRQKWKLNRRGLDLSYIPAPMQLQKKGDSGKYFTLFRYYLPWYKTTTKQERRYNFDWHFKWL